MRVWHLISVLTVLIAACSHSAHDTERHITDSDGTGEPIVIPFDMYRGDIRMNAEINGRPARMLIDNGILSDDLLFFGSPEVDGFDLTYTETISVKGSGEGSAVPSRRATDILLAFPGIEFPNQQAAVTNYTPGTPNLWAGSEGQVSAIFFKNYVVEIDFDRLELSLWKPSDYEAEANLLSIPLSEQESGMWTIPATIEIEAANPVKIALALDLGNSNPIQISMIGAHGFQPPDNAVPASLGFGMQGPIMGSFASINALTLGSYSLPSILSGFETGMSFEETQVGMEILSRFTVTFDYPGHRLMLKPNSHYNDPYEIEVSGMVVSTDSDRAPYVSAVLKGSAAIEAGVKTGDKISAVGGSSVTGKSPIEVASHLAQSGQQVQVTLQRDDQELKLELPIFPARFFINDRKFTAKEHEYPSTE